MLVVFSALGFLVPPASPPDEETVQRLVRAARDGDVDAARRLYRDHVNRVFRAVRPLCEGDAEAEDLVQDTFVRALGALKRYQRQGEVRFVSWLLAIALNLARRRARRRGRTGVTAPEVLDGLREAEARTGDDPGGEALDLQRRKAALLAALAQLSARDRTVVSLRYGSELSAAEVASVAGVSEANVRKICERARRRLLPDLETRLAPSGGTP